MPGIDVTKTNNLLSKRGFLLNKGDARRVAEAAVGDSDDAIIEAAIALGITKHETVLQARLQAKSEWKRLYDHPLRKPAAEWIAARAAAKLEMPGVVDDIVADLIEEAVTGTAAVVEWEHTPWDHSSRGRKTETPHDLSQWETLGEFMDEPSGQTEATFCSGNGFSATTIGNEYRYALITLVHDALRNSADEARINAPPDIASFLSELSEDALHELAMEEACEALYELGREESWLAEQIGKIPFRETLLEQYPSAGQRLQNDIAAMEEQQRAFEQALSIAAPIADGIASQFSKRRMGRADFFEVSNAIVKHIRDPQGIEVAEVLIEHERIRPLFNRKGFSSFKEAWLEWFDEIERGTPDFSHPLAKLFMALDDAWRQDGRHWYVTLSQGSSAQNTKHTFGRDNWIFFFAYALGSRKAWSGHRFGIEVRRFEALSDTATGLPLKSVGGVYIGEDGIHLCSAAEIKSDCTTGAESGQPIELEPAVRYVAMSDLCPAFAKAVAGETSE